VWGNTNNGQGYDLVLLGQVEPIRINVDEIGARLKRPEYATVARSLREIGFYSAVDLFSSYAGRASDLKEWLKDASINRDRNLRLQYLAGLGLNLYESGPIYTEMLKYRRFPDDLFVASPLTIEALKSGIQRGLDVRE
jgi:spermidine synthase